MLERAVRDISIFSDMKISDMLRAFEHAGGFTATKLAVAAQILETMFTKKDITRFLSFPAAIIATGTRGVIKELVKRKLVDVIITTTGTLDHDLARTFGEYYHGSFMLDDKKLYAEKIHRLGNVLIPINNYGMIIETKMQPFLKHLYNQKHTWSGQELIYELGRYINDQSSILYWAYKNNIPVFVPGIMDGAVGSQLWSFWEQHRDFSVDLLTDEHALADIVFNAEKTGALMIGGGISKHHTIWWNQFRDGLEYGVYITTAVEYDGSLSGARLHEAVSWGKIKVSAKYITVEGDATLILPILLTAVIARIFSGEG